MPLLRRRRSEEVERLTSRRLLEATSGSIVQGRRPRPFQPVRRVKYLWVIVHGGHNSIALSEVVLLADDTFAGGRSSILPRVRIPVAACF